MTLLKEIIHIPEKVQRGDFVLNLAAGLEADAVEQTLKEYVVTEQLARCFEDALGFIKSAVDGNQNRSKGAYLHGSFGSGKSHFMAVLHLLLQGNPKARGIPELADSVGKHDDWMQRKRVLLVPYHMIGAPSLESGILGGYARHIAKVHPDAPVPGFYLSEHLFADAAKLRQRMGDGAFFEALNSGSGQDNGWGEAAGGWDGASFERVIGRDSTEIDRSRLVADLVGTLFQSYRQMGEFVEFDEGLRVMTRHAKDLGYDAVILFLDELILWLASRLSDAEFITAEVQKVVKLVETGIPRDLPLVSFIARQRDLREFVGDQVVGAQQVALSDSLKYWEGRFHTITLEDRNLPVIAERRLLTPVNDAARSDLDRAFEETRKMREESFQILLTHQGDREMFRRLYPFSPALIQALVALSSALQRERTALKVMLMLLVEQRDTLELGTVIPVGDLYDVIASEAEPFSEQMRLHFDNARMLFDRKLIPLLEVEHGVVFSSLNELAQDDPRRQAFNNDIRLLKTLLLAALVPEVECFKQLTATKLAALNHGTIRSPIPGRESTTVLQKCRKWAGQVGEIKITDDANPVIGVQLSGVDTERIIEQARINDNEGNRKRLIRDLVFEAFGIEDKAELFVEHELLWRGTRRRVSVLFQNIREISDYGAFEARGNDWKFLIDFPFDSGNHSPADDQATIRAYQAGGGQGQTLCWLPYFFAPAMQKNLGKLVVLQEILKSDDSFTRYSSHLSAQDRSSARTLLENQRSQLRQQIKDCLMGAYGVTQPLPGTLDYVGNLDSQVASLQPGFAPLLPQGATMRDAFAQLIGQALAWQYPDHPEFDAEVKLADLGKVLGEVRRAIHATDGRIDVDGPLRPLMRQIAQPLKLGDMYERHFIFKPDWPQHLARELAMDGGSITVAGLREAMDRPNPKGLPVMVQNLLIMIFAEYGQYAFTLHGGPVDTIVLKEIRDKYVLVKQALAAPDEWKKAVEKAAALFGVTVSPLLTANNQGQLQLKVREISEHAADDCRQLADQLRSRIVSLGLGEQGNRMSNATCAVTILDALNQADGPDFIKTLAEADSVTSLPALARSIDTAARVTSALTDNNWELMENLWDKGGAEALAVRERVCSTLTDDELVTPLAAALKKAQGDITAIISQSLSGPSSSSPAPAPPPTPAPGVKVLSRATHSGLSSREAKKLLRDIEGELIEGVSVDISYTISGASDE